MKNLKLRNEFKKTQGCTIGDTANKKLKARIRTVGLPFELTKFLEKNEEDVRLLNHLITTHNKMSPHGTIEDELSRANEFLEKFVKMLIDTQIPNKILLLIKKYLVSFGPKRCGPNILLNQLIDEKDSLFHKFERVKEIFCFKADEESKQETVAERLIKEDKEEAKDITDEEFFDLSKKVKKLNHYQRKKLRKYRKKAAVLQWFKMSEKELHSSIVAGFEYATTHGPLVGEKIIGA